MGAANYHDAMTVYGMNRIRGAYLEIAPDLAPYFVMGVHDDPAGIGVTMGVPPETPMFVHIIAATPFLINVLNCVVSGAIAAVALVRFTTLSLVPIVLAALAVAALAFYLQSLFARREMRRGQAGIRPMFPTPGADVPPSETPGA